jgi:hypothetical protein
MKKKHIIAIVLTVIVVLIVLVVVVGLGKKVAKAPEVQSVGVSTSTTAPGLTVVISTSTPKNYIGSSFSFNYPGSWNISSAMPLFMTNFNGKYKANGVIPAGGIQLGVVTTTAYGPVRDIIATELMSATHLTTSTVMVDNVSCEKETYQVNYAPGAIAQNISLYCSRGTELWKIYFSYPANDPTEQSDISDLNGILGSMKLL